MTKTQSDLLSLLDLIANAKLGFRELRKLSNKRVMLLLMQHADAALNPKGKQFKRLRGRTDEDRVTDGTWEARIACGLHSGSDWSFDHFDRN